MSLSRDDAVLIGFAVVTTIVVVLIVRSLFKRHVAPMEESRFNFDDLLLDDKTGKASVPKCGYWFFAVVMALCMIYAFAKGMDPVLLAGIYLVFAAAGIAPLVMVLFKVQVHLPTLPSAPVPPAEPLTVTATATVGQPPVKPPEDK